MTRQTQETIIFRGKRNFIDQTPLDAYLTRHIFGVQFGDGGSCSGCWRGYEGTWVIDDGRLYLINIDVVGSNDGDEDTESEEQVFSLGDLFPGFEGGAFAHWYTGYLYLPTENTPEHFEGYGDGEQERLTFIRGIFQKTEIVQQRSHTFDFCELEHERAPFFSSEFLVGKVNPFEVEKKNIISDPFFRVSKLPFGFLNPAWDAFLDNRHFADELWSGKIPMGTSFSDGQTSDFDIEGFVFLKNKEFVAEFLA